jgi:putative tryptophan/tyrosine transport system substrate-binding protein
MRRRELVTILGGVAAWPLMALAQQPVMPVIGFLRSSTLADATNLVTAFRQGLQETGYVEGQNVAIKYRFAENDRDKLAALRSSLGRVVAALDLL